jgi:hypothetical protein
MADWFEGPWKVIPDTSLESHPRIAKGEILVHQSGHIVLACPKCGSMQFAPGTVEGPAESPTLKTPVVCGAGFCMRCGEKEESGFVSTCFTVLRGRTMKATRYAQKPPTKNLPQYRGLKPPPKIE